MGKVSARAEAAPKMNRLPAALPASDLDTELLDRV